MTLQIAAMLGLLAAAIVFFSFEWVAPDVVALGLVVVMVLTGLVPADLAFAGFGSDTVITILGLLILTAALLRTGVMDIAGRAILKKTGVNPERLLLVIMVTSAGLGAFMSNTASTAFFVPIVIGIARRAKISQSKLLLPLAFSSILTSSVTLISTSTNIVVSGLMKEHGMPEMGMFEMAPVGIPISIAGLLYMFFLGRRILPDRTGGGKANGENSPRAFFSEIVILPASDLIGKTLAQAALGRDLDLTVISVVRNKRQHFIPRPDLVLDAGDLLLVQGNAIEDILKVKDIAGIDIKADVKLSDPSLQTEDVALVEVILLPKSRLVGRTLKGFRFRERYGLQVLGINRAGEDIRRKMSEVPLRMGDVLLLQGHRENIAALQEDNTVRIIGNIGAERPHRHRANLAIGIFVGALALGTLKIVPMALATIIGSVAVFITRCVTPEEAYREVEWKAIILIGSMLALGVGMEHSGAAKYLAGLIIQVSKLTSPIWLLGGFFILTVVLTQPMSNQAAAVVVMPVAMQAAQQLHLNPRTFAIMIAVAASCSYLTPLEPSCLMVYGPGKYKFIDFLKVGSLLTLIIFGLAIWIVPAVWPLHLK
jgi:di/tricarboxylate transporter